MIRFALSSPTSRALHLRTTLATIVAVALVLLAIPAHAADRIRLRVDDYQIDAFLTPRAHKLQATAKVKFTAMEDLNIAVFELNNALRPTRVTDATGAVLSAERVTQDSTVRISLPATLPKGQQTTMTFEYEGSLDSADDSPVPGLKLAYVAEDTTYLLYAGRWFPVSGYGTNRFTSTIKVTLPAFLTAIGSGQTTVGGAATAAPTAAAPLLTTRVAKAPKPTGPAPTAAPATPGFPTKTFTFVSTKAGFPGTIIAGQFQETKVQNVQVFFKPAHAGLAIAYGETAQKEQEFFTSLYGPLGQTLRVVEIPDDSLPSGWSQEMAFISSRNVSEKTNYRLLANAIAHQWFGNSVSPATRNDWWIADGFSRYAEARYLENAAGESALSEAVKDMSVGALAYDTVPLSSLSKLDQWSPEFQALAMDKGGMVLHMLRWVLGDTKFDFVMKDFTSAHIGKSANVDDFEKYAEKNEPEKLTWFFSQWLDSTGAPDFKQKYTVYRAQKGFRTVGEIQQDLDLFRMPVQLRIDTDGKTESQRIDVVGTNSPFVVETFGRPRRIVIDPDNRVLKNSGDLKQRTSILRGQALVQQGELSEALKEFQAALDVNHNSSLAHYRIAEVFFLQKNYQSAANAYREALNGDGQPKWTEVWAHVQLGKIFDVTGQRERAINEYRQALQTNDNSQGAMDEARKYLEKAYEKAKEETN